MAGGELSEYVNTHSCADRLGLVCSRSIVLEDVLTLRKISDVADGLNYLHTHSVIHGDLKGVCIFPKHPPNSLILLTAKHPCG